MFSQDQKRTSNNDAVVSGVMTAMNSLCQALIPKEKPDGQPMSSPMKKAQLRGGMYIKQLNELGNFMIVKFLVRRNMRNKGLIWLNLPHLLD